MNGFYKLVNKQAVPCSDLVYASRFHNSKRVDLTTIDDSHISTVFLGIDHRFGDDGPPILFETMIFGGKFNDYQERCSTWDQAVEMHKKACQKVLKESE